MSDLSEALAWRGRSLRDRQGLSIGEITEIYLDEGTRQPRWALVATGAADAATFVPVDGARRRGDDVEVDYDRALVTSAPHLYWGEALSPEAEAELLRHYRTGPAARSERDRPVDPVGAAGAGRGRTGDTEVVRSEEELDITRPWRAVGRVRVRKVIVSQEVTVTVTVRREELRVEELPADVGERSVGELSGSARPDSGPELVMVLHEEVPDVGVRVVPAEQVRVGKRVVTKYVPIAEDLRRERVYVRSEDARDARR